MAQWSQQPRPGRLALGTDTGISIDAAGSHQPELESVWHAEWVGFHYRLALEAIRRDFDPRSVEVFEATLAGRSVSQCAQAAGLTDQAVYKIRQRIRARMEELILQQVREEDDPDS